MENNIIDTDSYKAGHFLQYPPKTTGMYSYIECRGGKYERSGFFGVQYFVNRFLATTITLEMVTEAKAFFEAHGEPFPLDGWLHIVNDLNGNSSHCGLKPCQKGFPSLPTHNVLVTVECQDPQSYWLVSWFETALMRVWYPITVATQSWHIKRLIYSYLQQTADKKCRRRDQFGQIA